MASFHLWNSLFVIVYYLVNFGDYIWQTGHSNWVTWSFVQVRHYAQCSSHRTPRIHYDSSRLKTIRKSLAKQRLPQYLWQKLGDLRIRKQFRSRKKHHFGWDFVWAVGPPMDHNVLSEWGSCGYFCGQPALELKPQVSIIEHSTNSIHLAHKHSLITVHGRRITCCCGCLRSSNNLHHLVLVYTRLCGVPDRSTHAGGVCTFVHSEIPCVRGSQQWVYLDQTP